MSRNQCLLRCLCDLCSRCSLWFPCMSTQLPALCCTAQRCALCPQFLVPLKSPDRQSLLLAEYTKASTCPHNQNSRGLMSGVHTGKLTGPLLPVHCSLKILVRCCLTMQRKWGGALSCMNHLCCHWLRGTCSKSISKSFTERPWHVTPVSLLSKRADWLRCPPRHWWKISDVLMPWC